MEERKEVGGVENVNPLAQNVWHPYYIDALATRWYDADTDGNLNENNDGQNYFLHDANFNITGVLNTSGTVVERYAYSPYGKVTFLNADFTEKATQASAIGNDYLFTGRRLDAETGIYYFRGRYFGWHVGRFVNRDPIGYNGSKWNLYGAYFVPGGVDPWGLDKLVFAFEGNSGFPKGMKEGLQKKPKGPYKFLYGEIIPGLRGSPSQVWNYWSGIIFSIPNTKFYYYDRSLLAWKKIADEIETKAKIPKASSNLKDSCPQYDRIILVGFSNGGGTVHKIAERLKDKGIQIDIVITADPVTNPENVQFLGGMFRPRVDKTPNVTVWNNFFQRVDKLTIPPGIRGMSVKGAERNIIIGKKFFQNPNYAHLDVPGLQMVRNAFNQIRQLGNFRKSYSYSPRKKK